MIPVKLSERNIGFSGSDSYSPEGYCSPNVVLRLVINSRLRIAALMSVFENIFQRLIIKTEFGKHQFNTLALILKSLNCLHLYTISDN